MQGNMGAETGNFFPENFRIGMKNAQKKLLAWWDLHWEYCNWPLISYFTKQAIFTFYFAFSVSPLLFSVTTFQCMLKNHSLCVSPFLFFSFSPSLYPAEKQSRHFLSQVYLLLCLINMHVLALSRVQLVYFSISHSLFIWDWEVWPMEPVGCHELEYSLNLVNYASNCL